MSLIQLVLVRLLPNGWQVLWGRFSQASYEQLGEGLGDVGQSPAPVHTVSLLTAGSNYSCWKSEVKAPTIQDLGRTVARPGSNKAVGGSGVQETYALLPGMVSRSVSVSAKLSA